MNVQASHEEFAERQRLLAVALRDMESALLVLDCASCPGDVGAHLDLAIHRLKQHLNGRVEVESPDFSLI